MTNPTAPRCCPNYGRPGHPKGDPTYSRSCLACGIYTRQWWNGRSFECAQCATRRYHANPPTDVSAVQAPKRMPLVADEAVGDPHDPAYRWLFDPNA